MSKRDSNRQLGKKKQPENLAAKRQPFPSAIDGEKWEIKESTKDAYINRAQDTNIMTVPLGKSLVDRKIRLHEQAHTKWTPKVEIPGALDEENVEFNTVNAVEDSRISKLMNNHSEEWRSIIQGVDAWPESAWQTFDQMLQNRYNYELNPAEFDKERNPVPTYLDIARFIAATNGQAESGRVHELSRSWGFRNLSDVVDRLHSTHFGEESPTFDDTLNYARSLEQEMREREQEKEQEIEKQIAQESADKELAEQANMKVAIDYNHYRKGSSGEPPWGVMTVNDRIPLTERMPVGMRTKTRRAFDHGAVPRNWHRLPVDQKIFSRNIRKKIQAGTILIDLSGSMSLSTDEVIAIIAQWPGVLIATYSGRDMQGELRIVARNGKRAKDDIIAWNQGGNEIDGPALEWLCKQKGPRVWISDGLVCARGYGVHPHYVREASRLCIKGDIQRIDNVRELLG